MKDSLWRRAVASSSHTQPDCSATPSPAPCYPVLLKNNHLGSVNLTQMHATKNKTKKIRGEKAQMWQSPGSQRPGLRCQHAHLTLGAMCAWTVTFWDQIVPVFFYSHCGHLTFEGQQMVLGSWWCSLELWGDRPGRCSSEGELSDAALSGRHPGPVAKSPEVPPASASGRALSQRRWPAESTWACSSTRHQRSRQAGR